VVERWSLTGDRERFSRKRRLPCPEVLDCDRFHLAVPNFPKVPIESRHGVFGNTNIKQLPGSVEMPVKVYHFSHCKENQTAAQENLQQDAVLCCIQFLSLLIRPRYAALTISPASGHGNRSTVAAADQPGAGASVNPMTRQALAALQQVAPIGVSPAPINITNATAAQAGTALAFLEKEGFIGGSQLQAVKSLLRGEERQFFRDKMCELAALVASMPESYQTDGKAGDAIAFLHYFAGGSANWYITEKDRGCPESPGQHQAFGLADLFGDGGDLGYISIADILENNGELDFHFAPVTLRELRNRRARPSPVVLPPAEAAAVAEFEAADPGTGNLWAKYEAAYTAGDRSWIPCAMWFADDMMNQGPPLFPPVMRASTGQLWACCEAWKDDAQGQELFLWFRSRPQTACRIASMTEIAREMKGAK